MKLKLQEALELVESADVVKLLNDNYYIHANVSIEDVNDRIMLVSWEADNQEFVIQVNEGENNEVERDGHKLTFIDSDGQPLELQLFCEVPMTCEVPIMN